MKVKITLETKDFTVKLPCKMLLRDFNDEKFKTYRVIGYDPDSINPWRIKGTGFKQAKLIQ